jgi:hypothetical protein
MFRIFSQSSLVVALIVSAGSITIGQDHRELDEGHAGFANSNQFVRLVQMLNGTGDEDYKKQLDAIHRTVAQAVKDVQEAKLKGTTNQQDQSVQNLKKALDAEYKFQMDIHDAYVNALESKIKDMREKIKLRREAQSEMVKLRLKVIEAQAEELNRNKQLSDDRQFQN